MSCLSVLFDIPQQRETIWTHDLFRQSERVSLLHISIRWEHAIGSLCSLDLGYFQLHKLMFESLAKCVHVEFAESNYRNRQSPSD